MEAPEYLAMPEMLLKEYSHQQKRSEQCLESLMDDKMQRCMDSFGNKNYFSYRRCATRAIGEYDEIKKEFELKTSHTLLRIFKCLNVTNDQDHCKSQLQKIFKEEVRGPMLNESASGQ